MKKISKPDSIYFDWDNTIIDSWAIIHASLKAVFEEMGMEAYSLEEVKSGKNNIHHSLRESFPRIFGDKWQQARDIYYNNFTKNHLDLIILYQDAETCFKMLVDCDIIINIVSNKTGKYLREEAKFLKLDKYFSSIVGANDAEYDKPSKEPVELASLRSCAPINENCWFIGDSQTDIDCAHNSNLTPVIFGNKKLAQKHKNIFFIKDYKEFITIINSW